MDHFRQAVSEIRPAFGVVKEDLEVYVQRGIVELSGEFSGPYSRLTEHVRTLRARETSTVMTFLIHGMPGTGLTAFATHLALKGDFNFVRLISSRQFIGRGEEGSAADLLAVFEDAYKSDVSAIILDDIDRIVDFSAIGMRFSNRMLQALLVLLKTLPPHNRKIAVFVTTNKFEMMKRIGLEASLFSLIVQIPYVSLLEDVQKIAVEITKQEVEFDSGEEKEAVESDLKSYNVGIKKIIEVIDFVFISKNRTLRWGDVSSEMALNRFDAGTSGNAIFDA
jgi:vesicle-fusing ATPase